MTALLDISMQALTITSFVTAMMLVIEYVNVLSQGGWQTRLASHRWGQYFLAAFLGAIPGCLGAFAVVGMYTHGILTYGAVIAAMISTMGDEAFVMLALLPRQAILMMGILFVIGVAVGALSDVVGRRWIPLKPATCDALAIHTLDSCKGFPRGQILQQWKECSALRAILASSLFLLILGFLTGQMGPPEWNWIRVTLISLFGVALFVVSTVTDHFLTEHLWKHVVRTHVLKIFMWTLGALTIMYVLNLHFDLSDELEKGRWLVLIAACLVGLIPESGPHLIFVTLYVQGAIPFGILLASSIVQDGHGMLPLLAQSRLAFFGVKTVNFLVGMLVGSITILVGW